ncbi:MAG: hypothetical protein ACRYG8_05535 [Janthinobacterium lividum]
MDRAVIEYLATHDPVHCWFNTHETLCEIRNWCEEINCEFRAVWLSDPDFSQNVYPGRSKSRDCWTRDGRHIEFKTEIGMVVFALRFGMHTEPADTKAEAHDFMEGVEEIEGGLAVYEERHCYCYPDTNGKPMRPIYIDDDVPLPRTALRRMRPTDLSKIRVAV